MPEKKSLLDNIGGNTINPLTGLEEGRDASSMKTLETSPFTVIPGNVNIPVESGVMYTPGMTSSELNKGLSESQSGWDRAGNAIAKGIAKGGLTAIEDLSLVLDIDGTWSDIQSGMKSDEDSSSPKKKPVVIDLGR